jgi:phosphoserine phosphatase
MLGDVKEILDPMSGYGLLTRYCAESGKASYCLEYNVPQYLWQILNHPAYSPYFLDAIDLILRWQQRWPHNKLHALVSADFYPPESIEFIEKLLALGREAIVESGGPSRTVDLLALALLLPFSGRLSCSVPGDISTHAKKGGMCVYKGWEADYTSYLSALRRRLTQISATSVSQKHSVVLGDARTHAFPANRFRAMITSPPYPNHRDFVSIFAPENKLLSLLRNKQFLAQIATDTQVIGSNFVSNRPKREPQTESAIRFLNAIRSLKRTKNAAYDDRVYYEPYFENYFVDLEQSYANVSRALTATFEGYIVVVNNTHRNLVVPVSNVIQDIWRSLGFKTDIHEEKELFHIGTKNRARGVSGQNIRNI